MHSALLCLDRLSELADAAVAGDLDPCEIGALADKMLPALVHRLGGLERWSCQPAQPADASSSRWVAAS